MGEVQDNEKLAELCGAIIGDGWIQSNERAFFIAGDPQEDKDYYDTHLKKMFKEILVPVSPKEFSYWGVYGISIYKKKIIKKLLDLELPKGHKAKSAKVPKWIKDSNQNVMKSFLRGFFDTDGSVFCQKDYTKYAQEFDSKYHSKIRLRMSSVSEELVYDMLELCKKCEFNAVLRVIKRGKIMNNRNCKDVYILELNQIEGIKKWFEQLNPSNKRHKTKYLIWKKFGFCPPKTTIKQREEILKNNLNPYTLYKQE